MSRNWFTRLEEEPNQTPNPWNPPQRIFHMWRNPIKILITLLWIKWGLFIISKDYFPGEGETGIWKEGNKESKEGLTKWIFGNQSIFEAASPAEQGREERVWQSFWEPFPRSGSTFQPDFLLLPGISTSQSGFYSQLGLGNKYWPSWWEISISNFTCWGMKWKVKNLNLGENGKMEWESCKKQIELSPCEWADGLHLGFIFQKMDLNSKKKLSFKPWKADFKYKVKLYFKNTGF